VSLYHVLKILWQKVIVFDIDQRAAAVSYSFLLAVFPGVIFLFTLIPYIPIQHLDLLIMEFLGKVLPKGIYENTSNTIQDIVSRKRSDILSFGFFFTVFAATKEGFYFGYFCPINLCPRSVINFLSRHYL